MTWTTRPLSERAGLSMIEAGSGPSVLLIHGVGLQAEAWGAQIDALADAFQVTAVNMPGHGGAPLLAEDATLRDYTDAIARSTQGPVVVIGHSMGAMIALDMAVRYPSRVYGVAALNAIYQRDATAQSAVQARAASLDGRTVADPAGTLDRWFGAQASAERTACGAWLRSADPAGYRAAYHIFAQENGPKPDALAHLTCPALFLTGALEPNSTPAMSQTMARLAPKGRAEIIDGAAHMMPMTHPAHVNAQLLRFTKECTA
ncbi:MAG: alpha/beta fold hydrolase [Sulfitobacter sp.]